MQGLLTSARWLSGTLLWAAICGAIALRNPSLACAHDTNSDFQLWHQLYLATKLPRRLLLDFDLQVRRTNQLLADTAGSAGTNEGPAPNTWLILRPILGYQALPRLSAWVGYAFNAVLYNEASMRSTKNVAEDRLFQQAVFADKRGLWSFTLRTRLEERHRSRGPGSPAQSGGESTWAMRFRQQGQVSFALGKRENWLLVVWDEVFVNLNTTNYVTEPGFSQNRVFSGAGYAPDETVRVELGYLNQYTRSYGGSPYEVANVLYSTVLLNFDLAGGNRH